MSFRNRVRSWAVVIPVLDEGEGILAQLQRLQSIARADVIIVDEIHTAASQLVLKQPQNRSITRRLSV